MLMHPHTVITHRAGWLGPLASAGKELSTLDLVSLDGACVLLLDASEEAFAWLEAVEQKVRMLRVIFGRGPNSRCV